MSTMAMAPTMPRVTVRVAGSVPARMPAPVRGTAGLHLTTRGRVVLWFLAVALVAVAVLLGGRAVAEGPVGAQTVERHVVQPGETMWQIAAGVAGPTRDVRDVVFDLVRLNELPNAGLMAGQVILVPAG